MMKSLMFLGGVVVGFAVASGMTEDQRRNVRERATAMTKGERSHRLASAVSHTTETVADAAVSKVETAADKVAAKVDPSHATTTSGDGSRGDGSRREAADTRRDGGDRSTAGGVGGVPPMQPTGPVGAV